MKRLGVAATVVVVLGALALLCSGWTASEPRPTVVPAAKLAEAETAFRQRQAPPTPPAMSEEITAQIGRAMGGFLVACDTSALVDGVHGVGLPSGRFLIVPTPQGALPAVRYTAENGVMSLRVQPVGVFRWEGASESRVGRCAVDERVTRVTGTVSPVDPTLEICGIPMNVDENGEFEGQVPAGATCSVSTFRRRTTPATISVDEEAHLEVHTEREPGEEDPGVVSSVRELASLFFYGPDFSTPGYFEIAYENGEGLPPETREWLADHAALEIVQARELQRSMTGKAMLFRWLSGSSEDTL